MLNNNIKEIKLDNGGNTILMGYMTLVENEGFYFNDDRTAKMIFNSAFTAGGVFLKFNKQLAETSILKYENPKNGDMIAAMICTLDIDEEGNKNWNMSFTFNEDDLIIDENTKVYSTLSQEYINSYVNTLKELWRVKHIFDKDSLYVTSTLPMISLKEFGDIYFSDRNNKDTEIKVNIKDTIDIFYKKNDDGSVAIEPALVSEFKKVIKIDGKEAVA